MKKQQRDYRSSFLSPLCIILLAPFLYAPAQAGPYTDSAHGNASSGVKRSETALENYSQANCAHCHEQHASIDGAEPDPYSGDDSGSPFALFADNFNTSATTNPYLQGDNFCFYCHTNAASLQTGGINNKDYAATFGGYTTNSPLGIFEAFNQYSYHNLSDIQDFSTTNFSNFFTSTSNPCVGCHNPHIARRNKENEKDPSYTAISKPSDHANLWGDDASERMFAVTSNNYMAPYYYNSTTTYEPDGTNTDDGSLTPDYNAFCTDCHNTTNTIFSSTLGRNLIKISWYTEGGDTISAGDKHGKNSATGSSERIEPYGTDNGWVLSCLDCHEPHGSPSSFLIRREVNGTYLTAAVHTKLTSSTATSNLKLLCAKCHNNDWEYIHHESPDATFDQFKCGSCHGQNGTAGFIIPCENCHSHGVYVVDLDDPSLIRRTF
ncbi:MAG: cytochrome c3 family protein [Proteobacteria bacterium]|nr:cytochrome c3 family protein [Pseudomonadota bacterium]